MGCVSIILFCGSLIFFFLYNYENFIFFHFHFVNWCAIYSPLIHLCFCYFYTIDNALYCCAVTGKTNGKGYVFVHWNNYIISFLFSFILYKVLLN